MLQDTQNWCNLRKRRSSLPLYRMCQQESKVYSRWLQLLSKYSSWICILLRSCVHTGPALPQALKQTNLAHNLPPYFIKIRFNITLSSMPRSSHCCIPFEHSTDVSGKHFLWIKSCTTSMMPLTDMIENTATSIFLQYDVIFPQYEMTSQDDNPSSWVTDPFSTIYGIVSARFLRNPAGSK